VLVDWFTIAVQGINFLILIGLLSRFLFKPILRAMDKREADIADTLNRARSREQHAAEAEKHLEERHQAIEEEREAVLAGARKRAGALEQELSRQARQDVERARQQWLQDLQQSRERFLDKASTAIGEQVLRNTDRVLRELSGQNLEQAILDRFLERIQSEDKNALFPEPSPSGEVVLRTSFPLDEQARERVRTALQPFSSSALGIRFTSSLQGGGGIELLCDSHKITWSFEDYLKTVRGELAGLFTMDGETT